jgi:hypothetical protein
MTRFRSHDGRYVLTLRQQAQDNYLAKLVR